MNEAILLANKTHEESLKEICNKLNIIVSNILKVSPNFIYYGSRDIGYYTVINNNRYHNKIEFHLDFRLYYPDKRFYYHNIETENVDKDKINDDIDNIHSESELLYAYIQWISIAPRGRGRGSKIVKELLSVLKETEGIEFVLLHPIDKEANSFWSKNGFIDENIDTKLDKRIKCDVSKRLIFKFT